MDVARLIYQASNKDIAQNTHSGPLRVLSSRSRWLGSFRRSPRSTINETISGDLAKSKYTGD